MNHKRILFSLFIFLIVILYPIIFIEKSIIKMNDEDKYIKLGFAVENNTMYNLKIVEKKIDRRVDIFSIFQKISETPKTDTIQDAMDRGYIVLLTLEPWAGYNYEDNYTRYEPLSVLNGGIDEDIERWNITFNSLKYKKGNLVIRVGHEVNGDWYPWGAFWKNNTVNYSAREYRYIMDRLSDKRLLKMWGLNRKTFGYDDRWVPYEDFYPGDEYVDIIGISGYNRREEQWMSFSYIYGTIYKDTMKFNKTLWIAEISSMSSGGNKAEWVKDAFDQIKYNYTNIKAVIWFNENKMYQGEMRDWAFDSTEGSGIAFKNAVKNMRR